MTDSNYVYDKGTIFVAPGGGGAPTPLAPGAANQALFANPASDLGVEWGVGSAMGNVVGPVSSTAHHLAAFADTSGELLEDSGILTADVSTGPASATSGNVPSFNGTGGKILQDSGVSAALIAKGVAGPVTDNTLPRFDGTGGKQLQASNIAVSDTDVMTFPANGGNVLTAGTRKGSFTLSSGTHAKILTAAAVTGSIIVYTISSLGTVTAPQAILTTIDTGVGFTPVSADATDTSTVSWAIVG